MEASFIPYNPDLGTAANGRMVRLLSDVAMQTSGEARARTIDQHLRQAEELRPVHLKYRCALLFVRDLLVQGWRIRIQDNKVLIGHPIEHRNQAGKEGLRQALLAERNKQLRETSVAAFIRRMERPRSHSGCMVSVLTLVADPNELAMSLETRSVQVVRPYLQLIQSEKDRDEFTGLRLLDIWRYFRLTWTLPHRSTPGRNMFYLIRDAGQPNHPVMGIAALGSSIVQITPRDDQIGWTLAALRKRFRPRVKIFSYEERLPGGAGVRKVIKRIPEETERQFHARVALESPVVLQALGTAIEKAIGEIEATGLVDDQEVANPSLEIVQQLLALADSIESPEPPRRVDSSVGDTTWAEVCLTPLYTKKRARTLALLLRAKLVLRQAQLGACSPWPVLEKLLSSPEGRSAVSTAIQAAKKERVGANMMDIIVCGAIPPYNELLGGKLVALLMTSSEVSAQYRKRYGQQVSIIASSMKGRRVVKDSQLVFLGTTSLYETGSSQYNRLKVKIGELPGIGGIGEIKYENMGFTKGFGSVYVSDQTVVALAQLVETTHGSRMVHNTYGEGTSPRLRLIRLGIDAMGLRSQGLLRHNYRRIVYGVSLARNSFAFLRGEDPDPVYILPQDTPETVTESLCEFWRLRWLQMRLSDPIALERVRQFRVINLCLGQLV